MSRQKENRLRLAKEIQLAGSPANFPCDLCFTTGSCCIVMADRPNRLKCAECVRKGRPCVNLSWASLDRTREEYKKKVDKSEEELVKVIARLLREKKILRQAEEKAKQKALCLFDEMDAAGELVDSDLSENCPAAAVGNAASPISWGVLGSLEDAMLLGVDTGQVTSSSLQGLSLVPMCCPSLGNLSI